MSRYVTLSINVPGFNLTDNTTSVTASQGSSGTLTSTSAPLTGFNANVAFWVTGMPSGVTYSFSPATINAPGAGNSTLTLHAASSTIPGKYTLTLNAMGGGVTKSTNFTLNIPSFTLSASSTGVTLARSATANVSVGVHSVGGFTSTVAISISGVSSGVTATLAPSSIAGGSGNSTLKLFAAANATVTGSTITVTATGGGITQTLRIPMSVTIKH
jgi:hypothetical protein